MGDEDVGVAWNQIPLGFDLRPAIQVEGKVTELGLPGTAVKLEAMDSCAGIAQVSAIGEDGGTGLRVMLKTEIMIASDDNFVFVWQKPQPAIKTVEVFGLTPIC